jgi:excisionase family DNA binding protein
MADAARKRTYTVTEAAELVGLSRKAISRRVDRGSLRSVVRNGRRLIPRSELERAGLLPEGGAARGSGAASGEPLPTIEGSEGDLAATLVTLVRELMDRVERQATEIAQFRALTVQAESLRADRELTELRARLAHLEGRTTTPAGLRYPAAGRTPQSRIWLPPNAAPESYAGRARLRPPTAPPRAQEAPTGSRHRIVALAIEAAFIVAVAVVAGFAGLSSLQIVAAVLLAWAFVAATEGLVWLRRNADRQDEG